METRPSMFAQRMSCFLYEGKEDTFSLRIFSDNTFFRDVIMTYLVIAHTLSFPRDHD